MELNVKATLFIPELIDFVKNNEIYSISDAAHDLVESCRDWNGWSPNRQWFIDNGYAVALLDLCERDRVERFGEDGE